MTDSEKRQILAMWEEGMSVEAITRMLPYKPYIIKERIKELRESGYLRGSPYRKGAKTEERILTAYNEGNKVVKELSKQCGVSTTTVRKSLAKNGIRIERDKTYKKSAKPIEDRKLCERTKLILTALKNGKTISETAKQYNVSRQCVHQIKKYILQGESRRK